jgi:hypothetical protein
VRTISKSRLAGRVIPPLVAVFACLAFSACASAFAPAAPRHLLAQGDQAEGGELMQDQALQQQDQSQPLDVSTTPPRQQVIVDPPAPAGRPTRPPREIRTGAADMVLQGVEQSVTREEVAAAVQSMIAVAPVCTPWPAVWLQGNERWAAFVVRYDFMTRDWGQNVSTADEQRMEEFVAMGFLARRDRPEMGAHVVEYTLTEAGRSALRGSPYGGDRPSFCGPAQRRLLEITAMDFGRYPCGNLFVRFQHVSDTWPTWATSNRTRDRIAAMWPALGTPAEGSVSLNRQWFRTNELPRDRQNGSLQSVCYDSAHERVTGDDLNLFVDQQPAIPEDGALQQ